MDEVTGKDDDTPVIFKAAQPKLVRDAALESIKDAIIHGRLKPGERLVERKLCEATGVGRSSIREVIRQLEADRLVTVTAHRGPAVARLTLDQAREIYELRADLEARLVRGYCAMASDDDLITLENFLPEIEAAGKRHDLHALVGIMQRFNGHMMAISRLEVTSDLLRVLLARISWLRVLSMSEPNRITRSTAEIRAVVDALKQRDLDTAEHAMRTYIANAGAAALDQLHKQQEAENSV